MRSVFVNAPTFVLDASDAGRDLEQLRRLLGDDVRLGIERGEMPADDLLRAIALQSLRARVPAADVTRGKRRSRNRPRSRRAVDTGGPTVRGATNRVR